MLNRKLSVFAEAVYDAAKRLGEKPSLITDDIISSVFPETIEASEREGADKMFRRGVHEEVKRLIKAPANDPGTVDFSDRYPELFPIVQRLQSGTYFVESLDEFVPVSRLVEEHELLDDARRYMRRKGMETLAEADVLDELYAAVTGA